METVDQRIPEKKFRSFLRSMPQVSVELLVKHDGQLLLAKRTSEPAKGEWFWPGGRLQKGETLPSAVHRIANQELGLEVEIRNFLGVQSHFWDGDYESFDSLHTVNIVYLVQPADEFEITLDDQHSEFRLFDEIGSEHHKYVRKYVEEYSVFDPV